MNEGKKVDLNKETNANTVADLLKYFFKTLPNPIFTHELYKAFMAAAGW